MVKRVAHYDIMGVDFFISVAKKNRNTLTKVNLIYFCGTEYGLIKTYYVFPGASDIDYDHISKEIQADISEFLMMRELKRRSDNRIVTNS